MFCQRCGKEVRYDIDVCECGERLKPQSSILHVFGIIASVIIFFVWGLFGGDYYTYEVNAVDYICAFISVLILLMVLFMNREANRALRITSIVFMSIITFLTVFWIIPV